MSVEILLLSASETLRLGQHVGEHVQRPLAIGLDGPLGAGKTLFVQGLARGLSMDPSEPVVSPTFVLIREYRGRVPLIHADAYRLGSAREAIDLGLIEQWEDRGGVLAIEWAERVETILPRDAMRIRMAYGDDDASRVARIDAAPEWLDPLSAFARS